MRKYFIIFVTAFATLLSSCTREQEKPVPSGGPVQFASFDVGISRQGDDSKSLVSIETEDFRLAYLFAFYVEDAPDGSYSAGDICIYPDVAGDLYGNKPVYKKTTEKVFPWALPIEVPIKIYTIVNPNEALTEVLESYIVNENLVEDDMLDPDFVFSCDGSSALMALDPDGPSVGSGMPMSGVQQVTLNSYEQSLSIHVLRLFSRYDIAFDFQDYEAAGYKASSLFLSSAMSNTQLPVFYFTNGQLGGFGQTNYSLLKPVDRASEFDLSLLDSGQPIHIYCLENCQGIKSGASSWNTVYKDLGPEAVKLCTFIDFGINLTRESDGLNENKIFRVYLGSGDMKSDFNVRRNLKNTITIHLGPSVPPVYGLSYRKDVNTTVAVGKTIKIPFGYTGIDKSQISVEATNAVSKLTTSSDIVQPLINFNDAPITFVVDGVMTEFEHSGTVQVQGFSVGSELLKLQASIDDNSIERSLSDVINVTVVDASSLKEPEYIADHVMFSFNDGSQGRMLLRPKYSDMEGHATLTPMVDGLTFDVICTDNSRTPVLTSSAKTIIFNGDEEYMVYYYYDGPRHEHLYDDGNNGVYDDLSIGSMLPLSIAFSGCGDIPGYADTGNQTVKLPYKFIGFCYADTPIDYRLVGNKNSATDDHSAFWVSDPKNYGWEFSLTGDVFVLSLDSSSDGYVSPSNFTSSISVNHDPATLIGTYSWDDVIAGDYNGVGSKMFVFTDIPGNLTISNNPYTNHYFLTDCSFGGPFSGNDAPWSGYDYCRQKNAPYKVVNSEFNYCLNIFYMGNYTAGYTQSYLQVISEYSDSYAPDFIIELRDGNPNASEKISYGTTANNPYYPNIALVPGTCWSVHSPYLITNPFIRPNSNELFNPTSIDSRGYDGSEFTPAPASSNPYRVYGNLWTTKALYSMPEHCYLVPTNATPTQIVVEDLTDLPNPSYLTVINWNIKYSNFH